MKHNPGTMDPLACERDVVNITNSSIPGDWKLGRVTRVVASSDGVRQVVVCNGNVSEFNIEADCTRTR